ncbi:hypothetical protein KSD_10050 [Ktedonobacter sp. SOSP1-85]|nr:hypothetical protein KSD_10050 [Ktedonobacter sp. SOSP1-85]
MLGMGVAGPRANAQAWWSSLRSESMQAWTLHGLGSWHFHTLLFHT